jgi:hypothetical protein
VKSGSARDTDCDALPYHGVAQSGGMGGVREPPDGVWQLLCGTRPSVVFLIMGHTTTAYEAKVGVDVEPS